MSHCPMVGGAPRQVNTGTGAIIVIIVTIIRPCAPGPGPGQVVGPHLAWTTTERRADRRAGRTAGRRVRGTKTRIEQRRTSVRQGRVPGEGRMGPEGTVTTAALRARRPIWTTADALRPSPRPAALPQRRAAAATGPPISKSGPSPLPTSGALLNPGGGDTASGQHCCCGGLKRAVGRGWTGRASGLGVAARTWRVKGGERLTILQQGPLDAFARFRRRTSRIWVAVGEGLQPAVAVARACVHTQGGAHPGGGRAHGWRSASRMPCHTACKPRTATCAHGCTTQRRAGNPRAGSPAAGRGVACVIGAEPREGAAAPAVWHVVVRSHDPPPLPHSTGQLAVQHMRGTDAIQSTTRPPRTRNSFAQMLNLCSVLPALALAHAVPRSHLCRRAGRWTSEQWQQPSNGRVGRG